MKKIYFLALSLVIGFTVKAQLTEDFESYPLGSYFGGHWSNWGGVSSGENIWIANEQASSGTQSGFIGGDQIQDAILLLGEGRSTGTWVLEFKMYVDWGAGAYYNMQRKMSELGVTGNWANQIYIGMIPGATSNDPPTPNQGIARVYGTDFYYEYSYPEEQWFTIKHVIDLDNGLLSYFVDDVEIETNGTNIGYVGGPGNLEGVDFYSAANFSSFYIDDIHFYEEGTAGVSDLNGATIAIYPTVVKENINISAKTNITDIAIYNTAGQQVMKVNPNAISTQVNMSSLPSGVYMVRIQAGKEILTKKIVVK